MAAPGGREQGEFHVNGVIAGLIELIPDNPALPTYTGAYREKGNGVVLTSPIREVPLESRNTGFIAPLREPTVRALQLRLSGKLTMNDNDNIAVSRCTFTCQ